MRLKVEPEDFIVDEVATKGFSESIANDHTHPFLVVRARKRDCAHFDLIRTITQRFKVPEEEVGVGGIKDRRAITSQLVTLKNIERVRAPLEAGIVELEPQTGSASLELIGSSRRRMTIGSIFGNRFTIVARELSKAEHDTLASLPDELRVPNYFGRQRFGRNLENVELGYALLTQDFTFVRDTLLSSSQDDPLSFARRISRRKRMLYVSAFQSALFNAELIDRIEGGVLDRLALSPQDERVRTLASIADGRVYKESYAFEDDIPIVSLGSRTTDFASRALDLLDLSPRSFAIRSMSDIMFEPVERASVVPVPIDENVIDETAKLSFFLPKGSYATVVFEQIAL